MHCKLSSFEFRLIRRNHELSLYQHLYLLISSKYGNFKCLLQRHTVHLMLMQKAENKPKFTSLII